MEVGIGERREEVAMLVGVDIAGKPRRAGNQAHAASGKVRRNQQQDPERNLDRPVIQTTSR